MKSIFAVLGLAVGLGIGGIAMADAASDERDLRQLTADIQAAVVREDIAFLEGVLHDDYVHTRPNGIVADRARFLDSVKQDQAPPNVNYDALTSTDIKVRVYGDTAVLTGTSGIKSNDDSGTLKGQTHWTRVFLRQNGSWRIVAFQATMVQK